MTRTSEAIGLLAVMLLAPAGLAMASDPQEAAPPQCAAAAPAAERGGSYAVKVTYWVEVAQGSCVYSGSCTDGWYGYTCGQTNYCCPPTLFPGNEPPSSTIFQATIERNCTPEDNEFPDLGILVTDGLGPDPAPRTLFATARSR